MTPRQRVLKTLNHESVDKIPFSLGFGVNPPAKKELAAYLGLNDKETDDFLLSCSDLRWVSPLYIGPSNRCVLHEDGSNTDIWGVIRRSVSYGDGCYEEIRHNPLQHIEEIAELEDYQFPSADWYDYSSIPDQIAKINHNEEYAIVLGNGNIFESSWYMRGFETMLMDLIAEKEIAHYIMTRVTDFFIEFFTRAIEAANGEIDVAFTADDVGQQEGLLISYPLWEEMIKPYHVRLNKVLHSLGVKIMYHTDGAVMEVLGGLVDAGIDILEALQFDAKGMDPGIMKSCVGDRISFHGGVSVQSTLPFGSPEDVFNEVRARIEVLGKNGGYIVAPSHAIQAGTKPENILALLKAAGRYK